MNPSSTSATSGANGANNKDAFYAGVTACLRSWSALKTAVEHGWGDRDSQNKAEDLRRNIYQHFDFATCPPRSITDVSDLEDALAIYMEEEFCVVLEDASEKQVSFDIWKCYEECYRGNTTFAQHLVQQAELAARTADTLSAFSQIKGNEFDDDDDDDDDEAEMLVEHDESTAMNDAGIAITTTIINPGEYASQPLFGGPPKNTKSNNPNVPVRQLGEAPVTQPKDDMEEVDEDGFAPVQPKGKRRSTKPV